MLNQFKDPDLNQIRPQLIQAMMIAKRRQLQGQPLDQPQGLNQGVS